MPAGNHAVFVNNRELSAHVMILTIFYLKISAFRGHNTGYATRNTFCNDDVFIAKLVKESLLFSTQTK